MKKLLIILICLSLGMATYDERHKLYTYGEGTYETAPDTVVINLGVQREGLTAEDAQSELRKGLARVLEALNPLNIPNENIKTDSYSLYPVYKQRKAGNNYETEDIDRYRTYVRLSIEVHQIPQVGKIADAAIKAGANRIENISFALENNALAKTEALKRAVENARQKALMIAEEFGVELLSPLEINESSGYAPVYRNTSMIMAEADAAGFNLPEGQLSITSRVNVTYETAPKQKAIEQPEENTEPAGEFAENIAP